ncbi:MAG: glycosyltransferase family 4 protein, partial [Sciscionella sp.]
VEIPNGVDVDFFASAPPLNGYPRSGGTIGFVGRFTEPRKGMPVLLGALRPLVSEFAELELLVVGGGDAAELRKLAGPVLAPRLRLLGQADDGMKARALRSVDVYCAPNTGGESFGMILTEAMAAGAAVAASDLDAFRRVLDDGRAGMLTPVGDAGALREGLRELLTNSGRRAELAAAGRVRVAAFDWSLLAGQVLRVYDTAIAATPGRVHEIRETEPA